MKLTLLGTGNALAQKCYNTCFLLEENGDYFLVDAGGGNGIFSQLEKININWKNIKNIFVTHAHTDHIFGVIWLLRMICQSMQANIYVGEVNIYGAVEVLEKLKTISKMLINEKYTQFIDKKVHLLPVKNGEVINILKHKTTFFDINSINSTQFGFSLEYENNKKLTCCGDEPCNSSIENYVNNSTYLMHEAFCLHSEADIFKPYEKHHSTVKDAAKIAQSLNVENLILYHTEEKNLSNRKELYLAEGAKYFKGKIFIPDDLDVIELS